MGLSCGIVGLPNVGKSTLFNTLSNARAQSANFPFCTIEPNIGVINVPDERLEKLAELVIPEKVQPNTIEIADIAGLVRGASKGEGLGNQFLGHIRSTHAIIHVVRCFEDDNIVHVDGSVNPVRDKEVIDLELQFKDLDSVEKKIQKLQKISKTGDKEALKALNFFNSVKQHLEKGLNVRSLNITDEDQLAYLEETQLLTAKPVLYVCNVDEASAVNGNHLVKAFKDSVADENAEIIIVSAEIEAEIATLESYEDRRAFLEELGLSESGVVRLIQSAYKLLNLITYFTAGKKEVRAWEIEKGTKAPQAAGVIHSDFEKGFIRAEVIHYEDYIKYGSESACRDAGKIKVEGKEYVVQDGDVMHFRFNV
ncbi:MAG: redox-regulated ATPase YchF [Chitinophagaceae bacterium]|nr:MAG: redox-regulated ATPase YchF [Chitinophagaceae bacterium]